MKFPLISMRYIFPNLPRVPMKFLGVLVFSDTSERMPVFIAREDVGRLWRSRGVRNGLVFVVALIVEVAVCVRGRLVVRSPFQRARKGA